MIPFAPIRKIFSQTTALSTKMTGSFSTSNTVSPHFSRRFILFFFSIKTLYSLLARQWRGRCALQRHVGRMRCATRNISLRVEQGRCSRSASDGD